jgi:hypothetical protein
VLYIGVLHDATTMEIVLVMDTELFPVAVSQHTSVTIDGSASTVGELQPGDQVSVLAEPGETQSRVAVEISARRSHRGEP